MANSGTVVKCLNSDAVEIRLQRRLTQAEPDSFLEKTAGLLRGGVDHSQFRGYVFALLFYKGITSLPVRHIQEPPCHD
jgi:type I restriction enzyme M protein